MFSDSASKRAKDLANTLEFAAPEAWVDLIRIAITEAQLEAIALLVIEVKRIERIESER